MYKLSAVGTSILRLSDSVWIPPDPANADYQRYLADLAAGAQVQPADPPAIVYGRTVPIAEHRTQTVGAASAELLRATIPPLTGYQAKLRITAVADNLAIRSIEALVVIGRGSGSMATVVQNAAAQNQTVLADHRSGVGGSWTVVPSVDGAQYVITVTGSAGRTVDWRLAGQVESFTPGGES